MKFSKLIDSDRPPSYLSLSDSISRVESSNFTLLRSTLIQVRKINKGYLRVKLLSNEGDFNNTNRYSVDIATMSEDIAG
jgi:hypothetical protein